MLVGCGGKRGDYWVSARMATLPAGPERYIPRTRRQVHSGA
jgi:hypothetical protein